VSRATWEFGREAVLIRLQGFHLLWPAFPRRSTGGRFSDSLGAPQSTPAAPATPTLQRLRATDTASVWAVPRSLAATEGIAVAFLSWGY
jgi:hypothetical protein